MLNRIEFSSGLTGLLLSHCDKNKSVIIEKTEIHYHYSSFDGGEINKKRINFPEIINNTTSIENKITELRRFLLN